MNNLDRQKSSKLQSRKSEMKMNKNFQPSDSEPQIFKAWEESKAFAAGANAKPNMRSFCIVIPPPNVTGSLHMGHAFNNTLQDILVRWHRMRGFDTLWQPGQDHAGIATQMVVERQLEREGEPTRTELGRDAFLQKVWQWKNESGDTIVRQLKRLGASCDWDRNRFTMDPGFHGAVLKVFVDLYRKGLIYRGERLGNWDPFLGTAISDLEVEQVETKGSLWYFCYTLCDNVVYKHPVEFDDKNRPKKYEERNYIVVATTRPETILGDSGIAVNPSDYRYKDLIGSMVRAPLSNRLIPIVADQYADPEKGTGAVKITPAHDFNDWEVGKRSSLRIINIFDLKARVRLNENEEFLKDCEPDEVVFSFHGIDRFEVRDKIVKIADEAGWLYKVDKEKHMIPYGDRSNAVIEPLLTKQWFVDTEKIVQPAIDAVKNGETKILPEQDAKVYYHWLKNIEPWCVSRQLWWGHQIPVWYDADGNEYCADSEAEALEMSNGKPLVQDPDVLDTWFSSGLWPIGTLGWPNNEKELKRYFPTSVLVTGFDIIFFWVARMMMMQLAIVKDVPFKTVYVHALVRDESGKKMSKSKGNVMDPIELIDEYGADAVRFTLTAMAAMGRDLRLSNDRIAGYRNFGTKLWNAARFAEMKNCKVSHQFIPQKVTEPLNKWIIGETARFREAFDKALSSYRFNEAANIAYVHVWKKFCDWYIEFAKPFLDLETSKKKTETQQTMAWALDQCLIILHPIMPFITEELWGTISKRANMLIHQDWPEYKASEFQDAEADIEVESVISLVEEIRSTRAELRVPAGAKVPLVKVKLSNKMEKIIDKSELLIQRLGRISVIEKRDSIPKGAVILAVNGNEFALKISDFIDLNEEIDRLKKAIEKNRAESKLLGSKLNNEKFLYNAPQKVINENRERLEILNVDHRKLSAASQKIKRVK